MYTILGATGNTGSRIAGALLDRGKEVRVVGRDAQKLQSLVDRGGKSMVGSIDDHDFLEKAFKGAHAAYVLIPPRYDAEDFRSYQNSVIDAIVAGLKSSDVKFVVSLSSLGAHLPANNGPVSGLYDMEQKLNRLEGINIVHLRPAYFMENLFSMLPLIKSQGIMGSPMRGDLSFPAIATSDIGDVATDLLLELDFSGKKVRELRGPADISMHEVSQIFAAELGLSQLPYVQFPYDEATKAMRSFGMSADMAGKMVELQRSMNEGIGIVASERTTETATPTTIQQFAKIFAHVYHQG